jgi:hypothetical protein
MKGDFQHQNNDRKHFLHTQNPYIPIFLSQKNQRTKEPVTTWLVSLYSYPITNQGGELGINHPLVPTYLVATKCLTYIPTYTVTTHITSLCTYDTFTYLHR